MHLKTLLIRNFRVLENIEVEFTDGVNVIVGPNAAGKTTVLEAIRLAKAMLAQRTMAESQQTLLSLGAVTPHNTQQLIPAGLARDLNQKLEIRCGYQLSDRERAFLLSERAQITTTIVQARFGQGANPAAFAAYLSSSQGKAAILAAESELDAGLKRIEAAGGGCRLELEIDFQSSRISTADPIGALLIGFLDQSLPPSITKFSYFPADRALPRGDVPVQIGLQDAGQELESHNSQPQLKYSRLKTVIFNAIIASQDGRQSIDEDFKKIFRGVLKGRELMPPGVNQYGQLSIKVKDTISGHIFDIDGMSSGEKGLVLTFLLISRTCAEDGIVLLDEPELHLNPAVCKDLLSFIVDNYSIPKSVQILVCSHSPEILAGAFDREECALFHLESPTRLIRVSRADEEEISDALRRLGTSESEGLLYKGTIFVEGADDVELLEAGFGSVLRQYKIKDLGGRQEVEKQIRRLQEADASGIKLSPRFFIFDRDVAPSQLESRGNVRVLQWERRCLENYLIDASVISALLKDPEITKTPIRNSGEVASMLKDLAISHLNDEVIKYCTLASTIENFGYRPTEIAGMSFSEAGRVLFARIERIRNDVMGLKSADWVSEFEANCNARRVEFLPIWEASWQELCDGKRLFRELQKLVTLNMSLRSFKKRILLQMRADNVDNWRTVESKLRSLVNI